MLCMLNLYVWALLHVARPGWSMPPRLPNNQVLAPQYFNGTIFVDSRSRWPGLPSFEEEFATPRGRFKFKFKFQNLGSISDPDQDEVSTRAMLMFSRRANRGPWPTNYDFYYPGMDHRPGPWVSIRASIHPSWRFDSNMVTRGLLGLFKVDGTTDFLKGRPSRNMEIVFWYRVDGSWVPAGNFQIYFFPGPPGAAISPPRQSFTVPFTGDSTCTLEFQLSARPHYGPRYGRFELIRAILNYIREFSERNPTGRLLPSEQETRHETTSSGFALEFETSWRSFNYGLLDKALRTLAVVIDRYGAFTSRILIRENGIERGDFEIL